MEIPKGYFQEKYGNLEGKDWIRSISREDRKALAKIAFAASGYGRKGGRVRAMTAERDSQGRFK